MSQALRSKLKTLKTPWGRTRPLFFTEIVLNLSLWYFFTQVFLRFFNDGNWLTSLLYLTLNALLLFFILSLQSHYILKTSQLVLNDIQKSMVKNTGHRALVASAESYAQAFQHHWLKLRTYYTDFLPVSARLHFGPLLILLLVFILDWPTAIILLLTGPLIPFFMYLVGRLTGQKMKKQLLAYQRLSEAFSDALAVYLPLQISGRQKALREWMSEKNEDYRKKTMSVLATAFLSALAQEGVAMLSTAMVAVNLGLRIFHLGFDLDKAFLLLLWTPYYYNFFRLYGTAYHQSKDSQTSWESIQKLGLLEAEQHHAEKPLCPKDREKTAHLYLPSFHYPNSRTVWPEQYFEMKPGLYLFRSASGGGKTTLLKRITQAFGHAPTWEWDVNKQVYQLFNSWAYIAQSLLPPAGVKLKAWVDSFSKDSEKLKYYLEKLGLLELYQRNPKFQLDREGLSGGELRRLYILKSLLDDKNIILLDEPLSDLDAKSAEAVYACLMEVKEHKTIFLASHKKIWYDSPATVIVNVQAQNDN